MSTASAAMPTRLWTQSANHDEGMRENGSQQPFRKRTYSVASTPRKACISSSLKRTTCLTQDSVHPAGDGGDGSLQNVSNAQPTFENGFTLPTTFPDTGLVHDKRIVQGN